MAKECTEESEQYISQTTVSDVFGALWGELRSTIGSAPTAALLRRAVVISRDCCPVLADVNVERSGRDYIYRIPQDLPEGEEVYPQLQQFVQNTLGLLSELMGDVLVQHLERNPVICAFSVKRSE